MEKENIEDKFYIGLCPICAVYLAKKGCNIEEILHYEPKNKREIELKAFLYDLKELIFEFKEMIKVKKIN